MAQGAAPKRKPQHQEAGPPAKVPPPTWKPLTTSFHASSRSSSSRVTCFSARPSMAVSKSSRYLGKGGDGSLRNGGCPPYHRFRASSRPWGPARARSTSPWRARMAAQQLGSSRPHIPRVAVKFTRPAGPRMGVGSRAA